MVKNTHEAPAQVLVDALDQEPVLDLAQQAILAYAYPGQPFTLETMRRESPVIADMSPAEYKRLVASFDDDRWDIIDSLEARGVVATWGIGDKVVNKKTTLALIKATSAPEIEITEPVVPPKPATTANTLKSRIQKDATASQPRPWESRTIPKAKPGKTTIKQSEPAQELSPLELLRAARFTTKLVTGVTRILENNDNHKIRTATLVNEVSGELGTRKDETEKIIGSLVTRGHLFASRAKGYGFVELSQPADTVSQANNTPADRTPEVQDPNALNENDIVIGSLALDRLAALRQIEQGLYLKTLVKDLAKALANNPNIEPDTNEQDIRRSVRRFQNHGYLAVNKRGKVALANKEIRDRIKWDKDSVMIELKELIGS